MSDPKSDAYYFDRQGKPLTLLVWDALFSDREYRFFKRTWVTQDVLEIVACWQGFDPYRVNYETYPPRIFVLAEIWWDNGKLRKVEEQLFATEVETLAAHDTAVVERRIDAGLADALEGRLRRQELLLRDDMEE